MRIEINQELLERYHLGQYTAREIEAVEEWLNAGLDSKCKLPAHLDLNALEEQKWLEISSRININAGLRERKIRRLSLLK